MWYETQKSVVPFDIMPKNLYFHMALCTKIKQDTVYFSVTQKHVSESF